MGAFGAFDHIHTHTPVYRYSAVLHIGWSECYSEYKKDELGRWQNRSRNYKYKYAHIQSPDYLLEVSWQLGKLRIVARRARSGVILIA
jgi:hypothetical protein